MAQGRVAALTAIAATVPLQLLAAVIGFLSCDPVAATGMGVIAGPGATVELTTLTSPPGSTSPGLGVLLITAGTAMLVPAAAATTTPVPATGMATAGIRFAVIGIYQLTGSTSWQTAAGLVGLVLGALALYAALALELEGAQGRTVLPLGRRGAAEDAVQGRAPLSVTELAHEPGVRPQL